MQSIERKVAVKSLGEDAIGRVYVNALSDDSSTYVALLILAVNRRTGDERLIDALLPDDRLGTVLATVRQVLGAEWTLLESWEIEPFSPVANAA